MLLSALESCRFARWIMATVLAPLQTSAACHNSAFVIGLVEVSPQQTSGVLSKLLENWLKQAPSSQGKKRTCKHPVHKSSAAVNKHNCILFCKSSRLLWMLTCYHSDCKWGQACPYTAEQVVVEMKKSFCTKTHYSGELQLKPLSNVINPLEQY